MIFDDGMSRKEYDALSMDEHMDVVRAESLVSKAYNWRGWIDKIPYISWPADWKVKALPPFAGAIIRYNVKHKDDHDDSRGASVYLDCYDRLGCVGEPYWEVYPIDDDGECGRCMMENVDMLLKFIEAALELRGATK